MKETKFKNTEIGMIPEEWEVKKLGTVFDIGNGRDYKHLNTGKIPVYGTGGLMTYVNEYLYDGETVCIGRKGTINMPQYHNGKIWTVDTLFYTYNFRKTDVKFLYYLAQIIDWNAYNTATGVPSLTSRNVSNILVSLPPLHEQHRIASALTSIDNLISSLGKLIEKKKNIKQGTMQQLLTGKTRLKGFNEPWMEHTIDELFDLGNGYTPSKSNPAYWTNGTIPWFRMEDIRTNGRILKDSIQHVTPEAVKGNGLYPKYSIILSTTATIGEHALLIADSLANQQFTFLNKKVNRRDMIDIIFFYHYCFILGKWCRDNINAGGLLAVNMDDLKNHSIYIPKSIAEQQAIATILTKMDDEITALEAKKAKYEAIKQGMMQQLLTGKIRLIG